MPFPKVKSHEPGNLLQLRGLAGCSRAAASRQRFHKAMTFQEAKSHLGLSKTPSRELGRDLASPELVVGRSRRVITAARTGSGFQEQMFGTE